MTITFDLSTELAAFVQMEVASGAAANEAELLTKAVQVYRDLRTRRAPSVNETQPSAGRLAVMGALVNLTGRPQNTTLRISVPEVPGAA
jgi:short subunit dehydrogenase-like uncharacterized protein